MLKTDHNTCAHYTRKDKAFHLCLLLLALLPAGPLSGQVSTDSQRTQQPPQFYGVFVGVSRYGGDMHADLRFFRMKT